MTFELISMQQKGSSPMVVLLIALLIVGHFIIPQVKAQNSTDLSYVSVAVYDGGSGVSSEPRETSMAALYWMFRWMNATVEIVNSTGIKLGILDDFEIIAVPGGYAYDYYLDLGAGGAKAIQDFVAGGGAYWGTCAGAYYACQEFEWSEYGETGTYYYGLKLFPGRGVGPIVGIADWPNVAMTDVELNKSNGLIDLSQESSNYNIMYYGGPYFETNGLDGITTLATYSYNDEPAMIAFEYLEGRVFLTGPHPEWEEDSFRDGSVWDNYLEDDGSEWELCERISLWLASTNSSPGEELPLIPMLIGSGCIIALVVIVAVSRRR